MRHICLSAWLASDAAAASHDIRCQAEYAQIPLQAAVLEKERTGTLGPQGTGNVMAWGG